MATNREGLTWNEWYNAASAFGNKPKPGQEYVWKRAWRNAEDPTEYASER